MKKPLFTETHTYEEYNYLYTDNNNMNYYSAKQYEDYYVLVDDYDSEVFTLSECIISSEKHICLLTEDRFLCIREGKYGVVDCEGWEIIPFVYDEFKIRNEQSNETRYDVCLNNRWGVINLSGKDICKIKYKESIPVNQSFTIVEDADTNCKGVIRIDGVEIIPTIFSQIEEEYLQNFDNTSILYFKVAYGTSKNIDTHRYINRFLNGVWGIYDWKGEEIIPAKFYSVHSINNYFIVGKDRLVLNDYKDEEYYIGDYDLYDKEGNMIIGGFNHIEINNDYFILDFGVEVDRYWNIMSKIGHPFDYNERINNDKSISIILDKELKSLVPSHLISETDEDIKFEYDVLANNISKGKGILVGEYLKLKRGIRYSYNDNIIQRMCVKSALFEGNNIIRYYPFKDIIISEEFKLCGLIFCKGQKIYPPIFRSIKYINDNLVFIQNSKGLVGIININEELIKPKYVLANILYGNIIVSFNINIPQDNDCEYDIFKFDDNAIKHIKNGTITKGEFYDFLNSEEHSEYNKYDLLYPLEYSNYYKEDLVLSLEEKCLSNITKNKREITTWFPKDNFYDFMVETNEEDYIEEGNYDWDDDWEYYNDNLDMDQQSPEFWNF